MKYDKSIIENTINIISNSMEKIKSDLVKMNNLLSEIDSYWKGKPSNYLVNNMGTSFKTFSEYVEVLNDYKKYLDDVLEDIKTIENNNKIILDTSFGG